MLLLLFSRSLVRKASLSSLFFLFEHVARVAVFSMASTPWWSCGALPRLAALGLVARRSSASPQGQRRCECNSNSFQGESSIPAPTSTASPRSRLHRGTLRLPVIDLAPRGEYGMVAYVEGTESSASSTSSGRPSAVLPIVGPPRGLLAWVS